MRYNPLTFQQIAEELARESPKWRDAVLKLMYGRSALGLDPVTCVGGSQRIPELMQEPAWQVWDPSAMIAIVIDDASSQILTDNTGIWGSTYKNVAYYAFAKGVPITIGVPVGKVGTSGYLTWDQLRYVVWRYGWSLCSHSWNHDTGPVSVADMIREIVRSRDAIENASDPSWPSPNKKIGVVCRGFRQPGTWTINGRVYIDSPADEDELAAATLRATYQWAMAYRTPMYSGGAQTKFSSTAPQDTYKQIQGSKVVALGTLNDAKDWLKWVSYPGARIAVLFHSPNDSTEGARLKNLIDAIQAVISDRTTYPYTCVQPVTLDCLMLATQMPPQYDSSGNLVLPPGPGLNLRWKELPAGQNLSNTDCPLWPSAAATYGPWKVSLSGSSTATLTDGGPAGSGDTYLKLTMSGGTAALFLNLGLPTGRSYRLRFHAKSTGGGNNGLSVLIAARYTPDGAPGQSLQSVTLIDQYYPVAPANWTIMDLPFFVPTWAYDIELRLYVANIGTSPYSVGLDNITVHPS